MKQPPAGGCFYWCANLGPLSGRLELLTRGDDNVVTLKRRKKSAESLNA